MGRSDLPKAATISQPLRRFAAALGVNFELSRIDFIAYAEGAGCRVCATDQPSDSLAYYLLAVAGSAR